MVRRRERVNDRHQQGTHAIRIPGLREKDPREAPFGGHQCTPIRATIGLMGTYVPTNVWPRWFGQAETEPFLT
jgi:hypothetical protein